MEAFSIIEGESYKIRESNFLFSLPYDTPYVIYIEPLVESVEFTGFLNIINEFTTGFLGYIWIIIIGLVFYYLLRSLKQHV